MLHRPIRWRQDRHPVVIGDRTARFRDPAHLDGPLPPFPAYTTQPVELGPAPANVPARVRFADSGGLHHASLGIEPGTSLYGTGEVAGPLRRNGKVTVCWNTDCFDYTDQTRSLYQSHPFVLAVRRDGSAYGVICETTHWCRIDLRRGIWFACRGHSPGVTVIERGSAIEVLEALAQLTGRMPMPPLWALGYQQCRWSYEPDRRVREIAAGFRDRGIPCDVIWLDIDYMDGFRCFTFDHAKFPDPAGLNEHLRSRGFHSVWMIDPGIKVDPGYFVYQQGATAGGAGAAAPPGFVQTATGAEHHGSVWPGPCAFPDFTRAPVRAWWAGLYADFMARGVDGVWNDMNEPAIFDGPAKSMPVTCRHHADDSLGGPGDHGRYHNIYGMQMVRATREGMEAARPGERVFVLTRSNFLGGQRYAATWTGDNRSNWDHLRWAIPMALNLSLSGQPFVGPDIGGFVGEATPELFARFMGIGALLPFARGHSIKDSKDHEPWSFGPECERTCRLALQRRYRLMPYLYTFFERAARAGDPIVRPVWTAEPSNVLLRSIDDAFLLGPDLLVVASVEQERVVAGASPLRGWRECEIVDALPGGHGIGSRVAAADLPRLFVRPGAVIPLAPLGANHTGELDWSRLTLLASCDASGEAFGEVYHDDGHSLEFARGGCERLAFHARASTAAASQRRIHGGIAPRVRATEVVFLQDDGGIVRGTTSMPGDETPR